MTKILKLITLISLLWTTNIYADTKLNNIDSSEKLLQLQQKEYQKEHLKDQQAGSVYEGGASVLILILLVWLVKAVTEGHKITKILKLMTLTFLLTTTITSTIKSLFSLLFFLISGFLLINYDIYKKKSPLREAKLLKKGAKK